MSDSDLFRRAYHAAYGLAPGKAHSQALPDREFCGIAHNFPLVGDRECVATRENRLGRQGLQALGECRLPLTLKSRFSDNEAL